MIIIAIDDYENVKVYNENYLLYNGQNILDELFMPCKECGGTVLIEEWSATHDACNNCVEKYNL